MEIHIECWKGFQVEYRIFISNFAIVYPKYNTTLLGIELVSNWTIRFLYIYFFFFIQYFFNFFHRVVHFCPCSGIVIIHFRVINTFMMSNQWINVNRCSRHFNNASLGYKKKNSNNGWVQNRILKLLNHFIALFAHVSLLTWCSNHNLIYCREYEYNGNGIVARIDWTGQSLVE